ncbi:U-scoloptoxin(19)-Sm1a isoform X2 [Armigeres subalbatus]|uniref:U-scoloptoxin(19)-Sm1a isoform X2 n=1 Tax=Armigeres subalbatus TaxID=124917 RepID=UPI002ED4C7F1
MKFSLFAVLLIVVAVAFIDASHGAEIPPAVHENGDVVRTYQGVNVYKTERACARQGGLCVHRDDCQSHTAIKRLCPENAHRGVECCYEVKQSEAVHTCAEHLGECMSHCHAVGLTRKATDCAEGETCCVLVA